MINEIKHAGNLIAIVISHKFDKAGVNFFTPPDHSQQLAFIKHPAGKSIAAHFHNLPETPGRFVSEVLVVKKESCAWTFMTKAGFTSKASCWKPETSYCSPAAAMVSRL